MRNIDIFNILGGLTAEVIGDLRGIKVNYAICKNRQMLDKEAESLRESVKASDEFVEYQTKCQKLYNSVSTEKEVSGEMRRVINDGKHDDYLKDLATLNDDYKGAIEKREIQVSEYNAFLQEDVAEHIKLHMIKKDDLPEDIKMEQLQAIIGFVEE